MRAMILAAGLGTRLRPMTDVRPKPSLPLLDRPLIAYHLEMLRQAGVTEVAINVHWLPEVLPRLLGDGSSLGMKLTWSYEPVILGTGGGIRKMAEFLTASPEPFFVLNGDLLIDVELRKVLERHLQTGAIATMVLREDPAMERFGALGVDTSGRILDFVGRARAPGEVCRRGLFTGVHVLTGKVLERLPEGEVCINRTAYTQLVAEAQNVQSYFQEGFWSDVGTPERYLEAHQAVLEGRLPWLADAPLKTAAYAQGGSRRPLTVYGEVRAIQGLEAALTARGHSGTLWIEQGAVLEPEVTLGEGVVIGAGARIGSGTRLNRTVVWPGAQVPPGLDLDHAIVWVRENDGRQETALWRRDP